MKDQDGFVKLKTPLESGIVCKRNDDGTVSSNVPWKHRHHSPTGFNWGYAGSGPADLALNIVQAVLLKIGYKGESSGKLWDGTTVFRAAWSMHQDFKFQFLVARSGDKFAIAYPPILSWIEDRLAIFEENELE